MWLKNERMPWNTDKRHFPKARNAAQTSFSTPGETHFDGEGRAIQFFCMPCSFFCTPYRFSAHPAEYPHSCKTVLRKPEWQERSHCTTLSGCNGIKRRQQGDTETLSAQEGGNANEEWRTSAPSSNQSRRFHGYRHPSSEHPSGESDQWCTWPS